MAKKRVYIVTRRNTLGHMIGEAIKLDDAEAARLINKVRLKDEVDGEGGQADAASLKLAKENDTLKGDVEKLSGSLTQATKENDMLTVALDEAVVSVQEITAERDELAASKATQDGIITDLSAKVGDLGTKLKAAKK